jgi:hypothetical protein
MLYRLVKLCISYICMITGLYKILKMESLKLNNLGEYLLNVSLGIILKT